MLWHGRARQLHRLRPSGRERAHVVRRFQAWGRDDGRALSVLMLVEWVFEGWRDNAATLPPRAKEALAKGAATIKRDTIRRHYAELTGGPPVGEAWATWKAWHVGGAPPFGWRILPAGVDVV